MQKAGLLGAMIAIGIAALVSGLGVLLYRPPKWLIQAFQRRWPEVLWCIDTDQLVVALTIDDGPSQYTEEISAILQENEMTATFFVIGAHFAGHESALQCLVKNGSELANHAMYDKASRLLPSARLQSQIRSVQAQIEQIYASQSTRPPPKYFRPGSGFFNTAMRRMLQKMGYRLVLGSIYPHDPQIPFWRINAWHILSLLRPGAIIICHDRRSWTAPMLRKILPEIRRRGYQVVNVTQLLSRVNGRGRQVGGSNAAIIK